MTDPDDRLSSKSIVWEKTPGHRRPALWAAVLVGGGILLARFVPLAPWFWGILALTSLLAIGASGRRHAAAMFAATAAVWIGVGAFRYAVETDVLPQNHISNYLHASRESEILGRVVDLPDQREKATNLTLELRSLKNEGGTFVVSGRILARVYDTTRRFSYGDYLKFRGKLEEPHLARNPGGFDFHRHLLDRGTYCVVNVAKNRRVQVYPDPGGAMFVNRVIIPVREHILAQFREYVPGASGALLAGYLLGETRDMPDSLYNAYRESGTLHLLAVSGSNVWLVLGLFWMVFRWLRLPRVVQTTLLLVILVVFCFATRNEPSVVRAGLMAALVLVGRLVYRRVDLLNLVGVSAVIILLFSPRHLFQPGFQLSYAAVSGILVFEPRIRRWFSPVRRPGRAAKWALTLVGSSVAATLATAPILAVHFGTIPVVSVVANLVMVPLAGLIANCALLLAIFGGFWPAAARVIGGIADLLASGSMHTAYAMEALPLGRVYWSDPGVFGIATYLLALTALATAHAWHRWLKFATFYVLLAALVVLAGMALTDSPAAGEVMLFDAGASPLVGFFLPGDTARLVGAPGAFSPSNREWVVEPYAVHSGRDADAFLQDTLPSESAFILVSDLEDSICQPHQMAVEIDQDVQPLRMSMRFSTVSHAIVADYVSGKGCRVLVIYSTDPRVWDCISRALPNRDIDLVATPACLPSLPLCNAAERLKCRNLAFLGVTQGISSDAARDAWIRQLSGCTMWSTRRHGGIRVELSSPIRIEPTIP